MWQRKETQREKAKFKQSITDTIYVCILVKVVEITKIKKGVKKLKNYN